MENIITKIIEQFRHLFGFFYDKPYHFLVIGIMMIMVYFIAYNSVKLLIFALCLTGFSITTIVEQWLNIKIKLDNIKNFYTDLKSKEKEIVEHCINNKILSYRTDPYDDDEYTTAIYSLVGKGFGTNITYGGDFIMYKEVYKMLLNMDKKNK